MEQRNIELSGGKIGVLLLHGFGASPESLRPWAEGFHNAGLTVAAPLLAGHGSTWQELNRTTWRDWYRDGERALLELSQKCDRIFIGGLGFGGALALRLAQIRGSEIEGLLLCNPSIFDDRKILHALPLLKEVLPSVKSSLFDVKRAGVKNIEYPRIPLRALNSLRWLWNNVEENLFMVDIPLLVSYSIEDHVVHPINSETIIDNVNSPVIREVIYEDSYHVVPLDNDAATLIEESIRFVQEVLSGELVESAELDEQDLINAEFESIVSGLSLDTSSPTTYLDDLDSRVDEFKPPRPRRLNLSQASQFSLAAIVGSGLYILIEGFTGGDPLGLGGWPAVALFSAGVGSFIWRTTKKYRDSGDDGAQI